MSNIKFVFFGTSLFSVTVLETLKEHGLIPSLIVTTPDKPKGRKLVITPPPAKIWAQENNIACIQPESLKIYQKAGIRKELIEKLREQEADVFIVASYGKIIPEHIFNIPKAATLNIHPSLLPKLRGATPIEGAILHEEKTGVSIMQIDAEMDHGPIVAQKEVEISSSEWPLRSDTLEKILAKIGTELLIYVLPDWIAGSVVAHAQDHSKATFTKKIIKEDGLLDLNADPEKNWRKIQAYHGWPGTFFFVEKNGERTRVKITDAKFTDGKLEILKVIPENKKEINFSDFSASF